MGNESIQNSIGGSFEGNFTGGDVHQSSIVYHKQESALPKEDKAEIESSISKLKASIEAESNLTKDQKEKVLAQVKLIEDAVNNPDGGEKKKQAQDANSALKTMFSVLPVAAKFVEEFNKVSDLIIKLFGLGAV
ncbi:hypothetical protein H6S82_24740 [Planktothrix sp. FACHB-1355]|uniref:Uncharacterized protein n=1 Tax=Aerosakkonema funiforme FACHB-1375 TaxID=2949571 RepID=A0A926ZGL9_9CYAN|nr:MULTISPECIES: hypothetical protein [Oscillatoriales]MBD2181282.1 hypothetical protein [Aerosakkonema funiforme FACHB-1375]MBD3562029.1 hypothetical protein [Planktothrix sp. FACHB-1355]